jgi:GAF domain-containing protein
MTEDMDIGRLTDGGQAENIEDFILQLQDLVLDSPDVREFLTDMAAILAGRLSNNGNAISCGITVIRHKRPTTMATSDSRARSLDELQNSFGDGPCLTALRTKTVIYAADLSADHRWPKYTLAARSAGIGSILAVPMQLRNSAQAVVNLYAPEKHGFTETGVEEAQSLTGTAAKALDLALSSAHLRDARDDLSAALQSPTVIDTAIGAIMAQNRCDRDAAFQILVKASSHRNLKLREVAAMIVSSVSGEREISTRFDE